jgi:hypothetical protein
VKGNPIGGLRRSIGGCRWWPAASGGPVSSVRSCGHGGSERGRKEQSPSVLTTMGSFWGTCSSAGSNRAAVWRVPEARQ